MLLRQLEMPERVCRATKISLRVYELRVPGAATSNFSFILWSFIFAYRLNRSRTH
jgi:hypothetical protein